MKEKHVEIKDELIEPDFPTDSMFIWRTIMVILSCIFSIVGVILVGLDYGMHSVKPAQIKKNLWRIFLFQIFSRESDSTTTNVRSFVRSSVRPLSKPPSSLKSIILPYHHLHHHSHHHTQHHTQHHTHHHTHHHTQHHTQHHSHNYASWASFKLFQLVYFHAKREVCRFLSCLCRLVVVVVVVLVLLVCPKGSL